MAIKGLDKLNQQLQNLKGIKPGNALLAGALVLMAESMKNSPVDTGANRNSAESEIVGDHAEMSFNMEYSYYLEEGTPKMEGKHYVQKAIDEKVADIVNAVANQLKKDLEDSL